MTTWYALIYFSLYLCYTHMLGRLTYVLKNSLLWPGASMVATSATLCRWVSGVCVCVCLTNQLFISDKNVNYSNIYEQHMLSRLCVCVCDLMHEQQQQQSCSPGWWWCLFINNMSPPQIIVSLNGTIIKLQNPCFKSSSSSSSKKKPSFGFSPLWCAVVVDESWDAIIEQHQPSTIFIKAHNCNFLVVWKAYHTIHPSIHTFTHSHIPTIVCSFLHWRLVLP